MKHALVPLLLAGLLTGCVYGPDGYGYGPGGSYSSGYYGQPHGYVSGGVIINSGSWHDDGHPPPPPSHNDWHDGDQPPPPPDGGRPPSAGYPQNGGQHYQPGAQHNAGEGERYQDHDHSPDGDYDGRPDYGHP